MASLPFQPFKLLSWLFKTLLSQIAWTIVRLELHHLWNPDWTYAMPQMDNQQPPMYGEGGNGGEEGEPGAEGEGDANEYSDYDSEDDDRLIDHSHRAQVFDRETTRPGRVLRSLSAAFWGLGGSAGPENGGPGRLPRRPALLGASALVLAGTAQAMTSSARTRTWLPATSGAPLVSSESAIPPVDEAG